MSEVDASAVKQHDANEDRMILCRHRKKSRGGSNNCQPALDENTEKVGVALPKSERYPQGCGVDLR